MEPASSVAERRSLTSFQKIWACSDADLSTFPSRSNSEYSWKSKPYLGFRKNRPVRRLRYSTLFCSCLSLSIFSSTSLAVAMNSPFKSATIIVISRLRNNFKGLSAFYPSILQGMISGTMSAKTRATMNTTTTTSSICSSTGPSSVHSFCRPSTTAPCRPTWSQFRRTLHGMKTVTTVFIKLHGHLRRQLDVSLDQVDEYNDECDDK